MDAKSDPLSDAEFNAVPNAESDVDPDAESDAVPDVESDAIPYDDDQYDFALTFTSTGLRLAVGINDRTVNIYDTQSKELLTTKTIEDPGVKALAYSPNNQELAISCFNGVVLFLDPEDDKPGYTVTLGTAPLHRISYSPWEDWLVFGNLDHRAHLCRRRQSQLGLDDTEGSWCYVYVVDRFLSFIMDIAWNHVVRNEFVTGCMDRSVRVWRILEDDDGGNGSVSADVVWGTNIGMLVAAGMMLDSVVGLDAGNRRLLKQRGAVGDTLDFERDEADVESDGVVEVAGEVGLKE
ncbi:WD40-repeat-containing domain protein [Linnemannia elongata]|nr:WD40-repeat-containing domain protein [Linnemannia elongata]